MKPGIYDKENNLILDWKKLGIDVEKDYKATDKLNCYQIATAPNHEAGMANVKLVLPNDIKRIGQFALANCQMFYEVVLPLGLEFICNCAFDNCMWLKDINIPNSVIGIGDYALRNTRIEKINIPDSVISLGEGCFYNCKLLWNVRIPNDLTEIPRQCFYNCYNLVDVEVPEYVKSIGYCAFTHTGIEEITLPGVEYLFNSAFYYCEALEKVTLSENLKMMHSRVFEYCPKLKELEIPSINVKLSDSALDFSYVEILKISKVAAENNKEFFDKNISRIQFDDNISDLIELGKSFREVNRLKLDKGLQNGTRTV